jgi:hypothetical protein
MERGIHFGGVEFPRVKAQIVGRLRARRLRGLKEKKLEDRAP